MRGSRNTEVKERGKAEVKKGSRAPKEKGTEMERADKQPAPQTHMQSPGAGRGGGRRGATSPLLPGSLSAFRASLVPAPVHPGYKHQVPEA